MHLLGWPEMIFKLYLNNGLYRFVFLITQKVCNSEDRLNENVPYEYQAYVKHNENFLDRIASTEMGQADISNEGAFTRRWLELMVQRLLSTSATRFRC